MFAGPQHSPSPEFRSKQTLMPTAVPILTYQPPGRTVTSGDPWRKPRHSTAPSFRSAQVRFANAVTTTNFPACAVTTAGASPCELFPQHSIAVAAERAAVAQAGAHLRERSG